MAKKNEMTQDDLMQLPEDIAGLVYDVQGRNVRQSEPEKKEEKQPIEEQPQSVSNKEKVALAPTALPKEGNHLWNTFLKYGEGYAYRVRKLDRKMYWIDEDIVDVLKACNVNRISATDKINAILRSFIELNKEELRERLKQRDSLI